SFGTDGSFTYTPFLAYLGPDSFSYMASDGVMSSNPATVAISVGDPLNTYDVSTGANSGLNWTINLSANPQTAFSSATGTRTFTGVNNVVAGTGNNTIIGNNNGDILISGIGNDTIRGGTGNDII